MRIIKKNKHRDLPQRIFEIGDVIADVKKQRRLCAVATHSKTSFTEMKSIAGSVLREMGRSYELRQCQYPTFIDGRGAEIIINGKSAGYFGEMSPQVIENFGVNNPVIFFEMDVSLVSEKISVGLF